jgi:hypothetical protein
VTLFDWFYAKLVVAFGYPWFTAGTIGLVLSMGAVEFTARMLPASMAATIATRLSWASACAIGFLVSFLLNPTDLGFGIALTVAVAAPSVQLLGMRLLYAKYPQLQPQSMAENHSANRPGDINWP